jgi:hypothetical protein
MASPKILFIYMEIKTWISEAAILQYISNNHVLAHPEFLFCIFTGEKINPLLLLSVTLILNWNSYT